MTMNEELAALGVCWAGQECVDQSHPHASATITNGSMLAWLDFQANELGWSRADVAISIREALDGDPENFNLFKGVPE